MRKMSMRGAAVSAYSLVEMLAVFTVLMILMSATLSFFYKGHGACVFYGDKALAAKETSILKKTWQGFIHKNGELFIAQPSKAVFKNGAEISIEDSGISFAANGEKRRLAIPRHSHASMALEEEAGLAPCLVLHIGFRKDRSPAEEKDFIRIVSTTTANSTVAQDAKAQ